MADTNFVARTTLITADWLNDVNDFTYTAQPAKNAQVISVKDPAFGAVGDGTTDDTIAIQAAITYCQSDTQGATRQLHLPAGNYLITAPLVISKQFITISGDGMFQSRILFDGVTDCITTSSMSYLRCILRDFAMIGDATSGHGLNLTNLNPALPGQVYMSEFKNLQIYSGGTAFYAKGGAAVPQFFSNVMYNVVCDSISGHAFHIASGPGNSYTSLYAISVPAGKAGYRMTGNVTLVNCNGLNDGDVWGAFGSETTGVDGFQNDFGYNDYINLVMIGCNVERFGSRTAGEGIGVRICNVFRGFEMSGCTFQRADADIPLGVGSYKALISLRYGSNGVRIPVKLGLTAIYLRDTINFTGTNTPSQAYFYAEYDAHFEDTNRTAFSVNIVTYRVNADAISYPMNSKTLVNDIYGGYAFQDAAISPRRISAQVIRYVTPAALTPVGASQTIDVTGYTKVTVTPAAAASIAKATFTQTPAAGLDYGRNGELIIEAGNTNLTIKHNVAGAGGFRLAGGADVTMARGEVRTFQWSANYTAGVAGWVEAPSGTAVSGSYTPTDLGTVGFDYCTPGPAVYSVSGNVVTVSGSAIVASSTLVLACHIILSLPLTGALTAGTLVCHGSAGGSWCQSLYVKADGLTLGAYLAGSTNPTDASGVAYSIAYTYQYLLL